MRKNKGAPSFRQGSGQLVTENVPEETVKPDTQLTPGQVCNDLASTYSMGWDFSLPPATLCDDPPSLYDGTQIVSKIRMDGIPTAELLSDLKETLEDIEICKQALFVGIVACNGIDVISRFLGNQRIQAVIETELKRRQVTDG